MKRMIALLFALAMGGGAQANLISYNGYTHDTNTDIVKGDGLEWLRWDLTAGMSVGEALGSSSQYSQEGWRVASYAEMNGLFNGFGFNGHTFAATSGASDGVLLPAVMQGVNFEADIFSVFFGPTNVYNWNTHEEPHYQTRALFGGDGGLYALAAVSSDYALNGSYEVHHVDGQATLSNSHPQFDADFSNQAIGVALVRSDSSVSVPEPSTLALFGLGLIGLTFRRGKAS